MPTQKSESKPTLAEVKKANPGKTVVDMGNGTFRIKPTAPKEDVKASKVAE